jgi:hypothetical protein
MSDPPDTITCVECGGVAHLISFLPEDDDREPELVVAYRCADCRERFDVVWTDED